MKHTRFYKSVTRLDNQETKEITVTILYASTHYSQQISSDFFLKVLALWRSQDFLSYITA